MRISTSSSIWFAVAVLLLMFGLATTHITADSPTFDEQGFLMRGLAYLRGEDGGGSRTIRVGHPLGLNALNASLLARDPTVRLPSEYLSRQGTDFHRPAEIFLWETGNDVEHVMFLSRLPTIWLALLLAAVCGRWAVEISKKWTRSIRLSAQISPAAGLLAMSLVAFDPNILAHARLVTTDLGLTAAAAAAGYTLWRFLRRPAHINSILAGIFIGFLLNTKFTALLFLPLFGLVSAIWLWNGWSRGIGSGDTSPRKLALMILVILPAAAFVTLWAGNGFNLAPLASPLPILGQLGGRPVPLANYLDQFLDIGNRLVVSTPSFLLGNYSDSGWWYYFPVAFLLKTPLAVIILLLWSVYRALSLAINRRELFEPMWLDFAMLLVPAIGYFMIALTTSVNLGYRHLLPILPFIYVFIGVLVGQKLAEARARGQILAARATIFLLGWVLACTLWIYPHFLSFFNVLAGGPDGGFRALVDSNLDWGQDLGRLADWLADHEIDQVWLSYFGEARPDYYGIRYAGLDSFPPRLMNPSARPYYPDDPAPGWYAISATTLQGVHFDDHDQFHYFRDRQPEDKIGYSIFLYEQPTRGTPVDLLLSGLQIDQIDPSDYALLGTNEVTPRWFDGSRAIVIPDGNQPVWIGLGAQALHPLLRPYLDFDRKYSHTEENGYDLYKVRPRKLESTGEEIRLYSGEGEITFFSAPVLDHDEGILTVVTAWRQEAETQPVKMFIHLLKEDGEIAAQWDGLDAAWEGWRKGDTLLQLIELDITGIPPGEYQLVTGLYDPENFQRWSSISGTDLIELGVVTVSQ